MLEETSYYDEQADKLIVKTSFDNSEALKENAQARDAKPENFGKYKGALCHVGSIHMGDVVRLKNLGYNLLSPDVDEKRRALCYIQTNEPYLLTVNGTPFARNRKKWA